MWHQWFNCNFMKLQEIFLCAKKVKTTTLFNNFFFFHDSLCREFKKVSCFHKPVWRFQKRGWLADFLAQPYVFEPEYTDNARWTSERRLLRQWYCVVVLQWICFEEKKLLNKVVIFVFFAHKSYSCSFIKLWLNHWCHMVYFMSLLPFWALNVVVAVYAGSESSQISSKIS